ncbi:MAG: chaperone modulator CbpM [Chitinophagaceae bacterium]
MEPEQFIIAEEFCDSHEIELSFLSSLNEFGLIDIILIEEKKLIAESQLPKLEKLVRLYYDLQINLEGIDAIANLLERINRIQEENTILKNRLRLYEKLDF